MSQSAIDSATQEKLDALIKQEEGDSNNYKGMFAIFLLFEGKPEAAAIAVIVGMLLDGLDGRLARMLNAQSEFGKQLDSLSDLVTFGVAPAVIMFELS